MSGPAQRGSARAELATFVLVACMVVDAVGVVSTLGQIALLHELAAGEPVDYARAVANDSRQQMIAIFQLLVLAALAVAVPGWLAGAVQRVRALGAEGDVGVSPRAAALAFYLPGLNLVRPYRVARAVWRASGPEPERTAGARPDAVVGWWWALFLAMVALSAASLYASRVATTVAGFLAASWLLLAGQAVRIAAAGAAVRLIGAVERRIAARAVEAQATVQSGGSLAIRAQPSPSRTDVTRIRSK